jgi:hypothetical protein
VITAVDPARGNANFLTSIKAKRGNRPDIDCMDMAVEVTLPNSEHKRLQREWKTISAMVGIYCHDRHQACGSLCAECQSLLEYATMRLDRKSIT